MNGTLRSKQGCWTCRLRRKKCDEKHPFCSTCESLTITCYGYGEKPDWMDNGERERAMSNSIKQVVKRTSRLKGRMGISMMRFRGRPEAPKKNGAVKIAPKSTDAATGLSALAHADSNPESQPTSVESDSPSNSTGASTGTPPSSTEQSADGLPQSSLSWLSAIKNNEAVLLMHFLDTVFPLQYPMYRPNIVDGGRGWLLSLLLRTKPLYHASLALSSYHRGAMLLAESRGQCGSCNTVEQERHLAVCLSDFQLAIKDVGQWVGSVCPSNSLGLMACVIQLVYFELFAGHGNTWQIHLRAATDIFCKGYWDQAMELGLIESPDAIFDGKTKLVLHEGISSPEDAAIFTFFCGVTIWLDIICCITRGKCPRLLSFHSHAVACDSAIKMENIVGSRNWPILQIGHIAALHEYRNQLLQQDCPDMSDFESQTESIKSELQNGLTECQLASLEISSDSNSVFPSCPQVHPETYIITRLFTLTASIYLYLVVHGYQLETQEVRSMVEEAIILLRTKMPIHLTHTIICPLFIIGSVSKRGDEQLFRHVFTSAPVLDPSLEHRGKILPLLEEIWRVRDTTMTRWTWQDTVRLSGDTILLL